MILKIGGNAARFFTTLVEVGDIMLIANIGVTLMLNSAVFA